MEAKTEAKRAEPAVEEIRIAMALNGGVSLAVWMGGCAAELDRVRRAGLGAEKRRLYDDLCECFGRRVVIDILSGASAGGINGGLLSAAMVKGRQLDPAFLRERWLQLGDLSKLLHDTTDDAPTALMDGEMFHRELLLTFQGVLGERASAPGFKECAPDGPSPVSIPSLDVTMTDLIGVERKFKDAWDNDLIAREHRPRFKFRDSTQFNAEMLAAAARTSASFPIAFEPWRVEGNPGTLAGLSAPTYGIDGGLLDNAPIRAALDLIPSKPASSRVKRYVCYLNGDPTQPVSTQIHSTPPGLREIGAYTINLPRVAPFVDQLYAIQRAVERPQLTGKVQRRLVRLDLGELAGVANALLDTYRQRRTIQSLEELLAEPGDAVSVSAMLDAVGGSLPWIPFNLEPAGGWHWGVRPAQRILHLLLDLLRPAIPQAAAGSERESLLERRMDIDRELSKLANVRELVTGAGGDDEAVQIDLDTSVDRVQSAAAKATAQAATVRAAVEAGAAAFHEALRTHPNRFEAGLAEALYGEAGAAPALTGAMRDHFLRRVLAIEVVRRAFSAEADIESDEELRFVQLTPAAPSPIFSAAPLSQPQATSTAAKLTGVGLGHFAGFYRRSWRANDFMWGRLDAAARIVDLLLDRPSQEVGTGAGLSPQTRAKARSEFLVKALLGDDLPAERHQLLEEALADAAVAGAAPKGTEEGEIPPLEVRLRDKLEAELLAADDGGGLARMPFTRTVLQRAAQLEIVAAELPIIRRESSGDSKLGSGAKPLELGGRTDEETVDVEAELKSVRELYEADESLPKRLIDPQEAVSDLGLRTITHASFVGLSAVRAAGVPMAKFFGVVRTPLLAIAGTVAESRLYRATVVLGFWTAALYLTSRLLTAGCPPAGCEGEPRFGDAWSLATLTALVAALGVLGVAAVPWLRLWRLVKPFRNSVLAVLLLGFAAGFAGVLAWTAGELDTIPLVLFTPNARKPPEAMLLAPLVAMGVLSAARLPLPGWLGSLTGKVEKLRSGRLLCALLALALLPLGVWALLRVCGELDQSFWQQASAVFALVAAPLTAFAAVTRWKRRTTKPSGPSS